MSNYNIPSSVDVKSSTTPGTINVYNPSGTNYVSVTAPTTLSGNVDFTLPSTAGTVGQYLRRTGPTSLGWGTPSIFPNSPFPMVTITVRNSTTSFVRTTNALFESACYFPFPGTSAYGGNPPSSIIVLTGSNGVNTYGTYRVTDVTNSTTIAQATTTEYPDPNVVNFFSLGTLSNVSSTPAVWHLQVKRDFGESNMWLYGFMIWG
jgi:hypothetical protein